MTNSTEPGAERSSDGGTSKEAGSRDCSAAHQDSERLLDRLFPDESLTPEGRAYKERLKSYTGRMLQPAPARDCEMKARGSITETAQRLADHACSFVYYERSGEYAIVKAAEIDRLAHMGREMHNMLRVTFQGEPLVYAKLPDADKPLHPPIAAAVSVWSDEQVEAALRAWTAMSAADERYNDHGKSARHDEELCAAIAKAAPLFVARELLAAPRVVEPTTLHGQPFTDWLDLARLVYKLTATDNPKDGRIQLEKRWSARSLPGPAPRVVEVTAEDFDALREFWELCNGGSTDSDDADFLSARLRARAGEAANKADTGSTDGRAVVDGESRRLSRESDSPVASSDGAGTIAPSVTRRPPREEAAGIDPLSVSAPSIPLAAVPESCRNLVKHVRGDVLNEDPNKWDCTTVAHLCVMAERDLAALDSTHVMVEREELERLRKFEREQLDEVARFNAGWEKARNGAAYGDIEDEFEQMGWGWFHTPDAMRRATAALRALDEARKT